MSVTETLRALKDPVRREILELLKEKDQSVSEILEHFSISQPAISRHLAVLKQADLICERREGKYRIYSLSASVLDETILWMMKLKGVSLDETALECTSK